MVLLGYIHKKRLNPINSLLMQLFAKLSALEALRNQILNIHLVTSGQGISPNTFLAIFTVFQPGSSSGVGFTGEKEFFKTITLQNDRVGGRRRGFLVL